MTTSTYDPPAPVWQPPPPAEIVAAETPRDRSLLWQRATFGGLLVGTALLFLIGLDKSGWANQFYAAAAQAGSKSWKAMLFGSLDASNYITVDKPPASLWVMDLSMRFFGVNSWSLLVPQALEGVGAVALLYLAVKRVSGHTAGLLAGAALALTPIATLMFRFDNPDAMLVLLMTGAAYATVRATEKASWRWLTLCGVLLGFAFLTKMLQGLIVVPAFALAYLIAAPTGLGARIRHLLIAGAGLVVAAGWWVALVELWPAGSRPYIGGSTNNSILELTFGYNGFGRLTGSDNNGTPGGNGGGGFSSGSTGLTRLFGTDMGSQISWLLPAALVATAALAWFTRRAPRTDSVHASVLVWGGWLLLNGLVFSYASGIIHPYYTVALAPPIAALIGIGVVQLWRRRSDAGGARFWLAGLLAAGAWWSWTLLGRADWHPELRWVVLVAGVLAVAAVLVQRVGAWLVGGLAAITLLAAPAAYSLETASTAHTGALVTAGPATAGGFGPGGGGGPGGTRGGPGGTPPNGANFPGGNGGPGGTTNGSTNGGPPAMPGQAGTGSTNGSTTGQQGMPSRTGGTGGGAGGLGGASTVNSALVTALKSGDYTWSAATTGANEAASLELASGTSVMAIGGFNGTDNSMTLAQFEALVKAGKIHYYIANSQGFIGSTSSTGTAAQQIQQWVAANYSTTTIGGTTVYNLTS